MYFFKTRSRAACCCSLERDSLTISCEAIEYFLPFEIGEAYLDHLWGRGITIYRSQMIREGYVRRVTASIEETVGSLRL